MASAITSYKEKWEALKARSSGLSKKVEHRTDKLITQGLVVGGGVAAGFIDGAAGGEAKIAGIPVTVGLGLAGVVADLMGFGGKHADKLGAVGAGMLAVSAYKATKPLGMNARGKANQLVSSFRRPTQQGAFQPTSFRRLNPGQRRVAGVSGNFVTEDQIRSL
jgi:hypothetical protein